MEKKRDEAVQNAQKVSVEKRKLQEKLDEIEKVDNKSLTGSLSFRIFFYWPYIH